MYTQIEWALTTRLPISGYSTIGVLTAIVVDNIGTQFDQLAAGKPTSRTLIFKYHHNSE